VGAAWELCEELTLTVGAAWELCEELTLTMGAAWELCEELTLTEEQLGSYGRSSHSQRSS